MTLATLSNTFTGAVLGAAFTAYTSQNNQSVKDPVSNIIRGAQWGAVLPTIIETIHVVATKILEFNVFSALNQVGQLFGRVVALGASHPYATALVAGGILLAFAASHLPQQKPENVQA